MKTNRTFMISAKLFLLGAVCAFVTVAHAETAPAKPAKTKPPKVTTETSYIGPATEQVVVTERYKDGTVIRVVQILHKDGTSETTGERKVLVVKG